MLVYDSGVTPGSAAVSEVRRRLMRLCGEGLDSRALMLGVLHETRRAIPCQGSCIATIDPATLMLTSSIGEGFPPNLSARFLEIEYSEPDFNKFADLARRTPPVGVLSEAAGGAFERSPRWREINQPAGLHDEVRAALVVDGDCWGALDLLRSPEAGTFTSQEVEWLASVSTPVATALRAALVVDSPRVENTEHGPGLVILTEDLRPHAISPAAQRWIDELKQLESPWMGPLPNAIYAVVGRLRELDATAEVMPRVRLQLAGGQWVAVQASWLLTASGERNIAVIIEPPGATEIAPLIVRAYALTDRESEIVRLVLQGLSTKEVARRLTISPLTVQQHLKAIFDKVGVHSRGQLIGRVFQQHYLPRIAAHQAVGVDGWFAE